MELASISNIFGSLNDLWLAISLWARTSYVGSMKTLEFLGYLGIGIGVVRVIIQQVKLFVRKPDGTLRYPTDISFIYYCMLLVGNSLIIFNYLVQENLNMIAIWNQTYVMAAFVLVIIIQHHRGNHF